MVGVAYIFPVLHWQRLGIDRRSSRAVCRSKGKGDCRRASERNGSVGIWCLRFCSRGFSACLSVAKYLCFFVSQPSFSEANAVPEVHSATFGGGL